MNYRFLAEALERGYASVTDCRYLGGREDYLGGDDYPRYGRRDQIEVTIRMDAELERYFRGRDRGYKGSRYDSIFIDGPVTISKEDIGTVLNYFESETEDSKEKNYRKFEAQKQLWAGAYDTLIQKFESYKASWANANDAAYNTLMARFDKYKRDWAEAEARKLDDIRNCFTALVNATKVVVLAWADSISEYYARTALLELR